MRTPIFFGPGVPVWAEGAFAEHELGFKGEHAVFVIRVARGCLRVLLSWGSVSSIYYGEEIGLRYLTGLPVREGSRRS